MTVSGAREDPSAASLPTAAHAALVVVNYGSHGLLRRNLAWTFPDDGGHRPADVVVVDNFKSTADSQLVSALAADAGWRLVSTDVNAGFGAGVNAGVARAFDDGAEIAVIMNPDLRLDAQQVEMLREQVARDPMCLIAPRIVDTQGRGWGRLGRIELRTGRLHTVDTGEGPVWVSGACLAVHRTLWDRLGGMDPDYFMYWEDVDLSVRTVALGGTVRVVDDVVAVHDVGGTQQVANGKSALHYYFNTRNRLLFAAKQLGPRDRLRWLLRTPADVRRVITRGGPTSRWFRLRTALPPAARGALVGALFLLRTPGRARPRGEVQA